VDVNVEVTDVEVTVVEVSVDVEVNVAVVYIQSSTTGTDDSTHSTMSLGSPISSSSFSTNSWNCEVLSYRRNNVSSVSSVFVPSTVTV